MVPMDIKVVSPTKIQLNVGKYTQPPMEPQCDLKMSEVLPSCAFCAWFASSGQEVNSKDDMHMPFVNHGIILRCMLIYMRIHSLSLYIYLSFFWGGGEGGECTVFICIYGSLSIYASNCIGWMGGWMGGWLGTPRHTTGTGRLLRLFRKFAMLKELRKCLGSGRFIFSCWFMVLPGRKLWGDPSMKLRPLILRKEIQTRNAKDQTMRSPRRTFFDWHFKSLPFCQLAHYDTGPAWPGKHQGSCWWQQVASKRYSGHSFSVPWPHNKRQLYDKENWWTVGLRDHLFIIVSPTMTSTQTPGSNNQQ